MVPHLARSQTGAENSREGGKQVLLWAGRAALVSELSGLYRHVAVVACALTWSHSPLPQHRS